MVIKWGQRFMVTATSVSLLAAIIFLALYYKSNSSHIRNVKVELQHAKLNISKTKFQKVIARYADNHNVIATSLVDSGYLDLAVNLYLSSYKRFGITNYLFISADIEACTSFKQIISDIHCFHYVDDLDGGKAYSFGSVQFVRKTHLKTLVVRDMLQLGFNVLLVDLDIVMLKNPFPYLMKCENCDFQVQHDHNMPVNSGFYFVRPTKLAIKMFNLAWNRTLITADRNMHGDQTVILDILKKFNKSENDFKFKIVPESVFSNGYYYFHINKFMFAYDGKIPPETIIVHGNYIISKAAKIYRFKEQLMWFYDDNGYYSDPNTKYLLYNNTIPEEGTLDVVDLEENALRSAMTIGYILNRVVILPSFSCKGCRNGACQNVHHRCSFHTHFKIELFDKYFGGRYREHVFLRHHLVPKDILKSRSHIININTSFTKSNLQLFPSSTSQQTNVVHYTPKKASKGATIGEIKDWFSKYNNVSILQFHSLYKSVQPLPDTAEYKAIRRKLELGFSRSNYLQNG